MSTTLHLTTRVLPGNRIEITAPELREGDAVEVTLVVAPSMSTNVKPLVVDGVCVEVPHDLYECLQFESEERGITLAEAYKEEIEARRHLDRNNLTNEDLDRIAPRKR